MTRYTRAGAPQERKAQAATPWAELGNSTARQQDRRKGLAKNLKKGKLKNMKKDVPDKSSSSADMSSGGADYRYSTKKPKKKRQWQKTEWELLNSEPEETGVAADLLKIDEDKDNPAKFKIRDRTQGAGPSKGLQDRLKEVQDSMGTFTDQEKKELAEFVTKDDRREGRRVKRIEMRTTSKTCFNCRETGHDMSSCPKMKKDVEQGTGICFKCGSTEHAINRCHVKLPPGEFPYAKCFICGEQGHLSKQCPDNPRGLYPNGGCCRECGSVEHYRKDCPELQKEQGLEGFSVTRIKAVGSVDEEEAFIETKPIVKKAKPKIVKF